MVVRGACQLDKVGGEIPPSWPGKTTVNMEHHVKLAVLGIVFLIMFHMHMARQVARHGAFHNVTIKREVAPEEKTEETVDRPRFVGVAIQRAGMVCNLTDYKTAVLYYAWSHYFSQCCHVNESNCS